MKNKMRLQIELMKHKKFFKKNYNRELTPFEEGVILESIKLNEKLTRNRNGNRKTK